MSANARLAATWTPGQRAPTPTPPVRPRRLGAAELSAAILATSLFNVTGLSVLTGFSAAMETLAGQAYGAKSYRAVGVVLQRALIIVTLLTALLATVWSKAESLLLLAGQDEEIAAMAAHYILRMIPALYCVGLSEAFKRYLMAQRCVRPVAAVTILALLVAPFFNWLFVFRLGLGFDGAAYAVDAVQAFMAACLGGFIVMRDYRRAGTPTATWCGWSADAFRRWPQYFKFAVPSVVMVRVGGGGGGGGGALWGGPLLVNRGWVAACLRAWMGPCLPCCGLCMRSRLDALAPWPFCAPRFAWNGGPLNV